ncbi:MAG: ParB/RepB/Spo0J family partition protein [Phascolarctobacterium sp.]|nr:ParB/RepB/Spo0J family partition protein [Phascolarctobacterium sp.]
MFVDDGFWVLEPENTGINGYSSGVEVKVAKVDIDKIFPNPYQSRKNFDAEELNELATSIAEYGVLQPLLVAPSDDDGRYLLIAGERRLCAAKMAKLDKVPVIISECTSQQIAEIDLVENLQREDLNFFEEAEEYEHLMKTFHITQGTIASSVGKKQSTIANKLRLLRLPAKVRAILIDNGLSERHARALLQLESEERQLEVLNVILDTGYSVRQTENYIAKLLEGRERDKSKRMVIVNDVRIYLNSIKQIMSAIKDAGIPASMEQKVNDDDVVVTMRIKNMKKPRGGSITPLF